MDLYGLSEVIGPGVAQECIETKDGLTVWEDHFYPEIVDPESGALLPDGEKGEPDRNADAQPGGAFEQLSRKPRSNLLGSHWPPFVVVSKDNQQKDG